MFINKHLERLLWLVLVAALIYTAHNTLKTFVLMIFKVPTPSMEPTVMAGSKNLPLRVCISTPKGIVFYDFASYLCSVERQRTLASKSWTEVRDVKHNEKSY